MQSFFSTLAMTWPKGHGSVLAEARTCLSERSPGSSIEACFASEARYRASNKSSSSRKRSSVSSGVEEIVNEVAVVSAWRKERMGQER